MCDYESITKNHWANELSMAWTSLKIHCFGRDKGEA
jgi:hypothetical protein